MRLPPLREREGDVVLLARHYLAKYGEQFRGRPLTLGKDAEPLLLAHGWPGNVRELQNVVQRALLKLPGSRLGAKELLGLLPAGATNDRGLAGLVEQILDGPAPESGGTRRRCRPWKGRSSPRRCSARTETSSARRSSSA